MCAWWMYKCNSLNRPHQPAYGDWRELFEDRTPKSWGRTEWVPDLARLSPGDGVLCYQTNRNQLVGVARVVHLRNVDGTQELWLEPGEALGVKVRPLKQADRAIAAIPALEQGPVRTIYEITDADANRLLRAARAVMQRDVGVFPEGGLRTTSGAVRNRKLRDAAKEFWGCRCYCCDFDFEEFYGPTARGVAVVHHLETFEGARGVVRGTTVHDVRVVCDNCHRVLHLTRPPLSVDALRERVSTGLLGTRRHGASGANVRRVGRMG